MLRTLLILAACGLLGLLAGCGNKGPLYRPKPAAAASAGAPATPASAPAPDATVPMDDSSD